VWYCDCQGFRGICCFLFQEFFNILPTLFISVKSVAVRCYLTCIIQISLMLYKILKYEQLGLLSKCDIVCGKFNVYLVGVCMFEFIYIYIYYIKVKVTP
jgi:hypothetical protein